MDGMYAMTREDLEHFLEIVNGLCADEKTHEEARARLRDEGLTDAEANLVIRAYMELYGPKS